MPVERQFAARSRLARLVDGHDGGMNCSQFPFSTRVCTRSAAIPSKRLAVFRHHLNPALIHTHNPKAISTVWRSSGSGPQGNRPRLVIWSVRGGFSRSFWIGASASEEFHEVSLVRGAIGKRTHGSLIKRTPFTITIEMLGDEQHLTIPHMKIIAAERLW